MVTISMIGAGKERAQRAALLALVTVYCCRRVSGCRHGESAVLPQHSVRFSALLPLHPAWEQLRRMEEEAEEIPAAQVDVRIEPVVMTEPFAPPQGLPPNRVADHEKVVHEDAARYIAQLEASLAVRNRELTDAERHAASQLARTKYNTAIEKRTNELRDDAVSKSKVLQQQLQQLNFRLEALASQARVYTTVGPNARRMLDDVKLQQAEVDRQAQLKNTEITGMLRADFKGLAEESLKGYKSQLDAEAATHAADFQLRQSRADEQEISQARARVDSQPTVIPPLVDRSGEISVPGAVALVQGVADTKQLSVRTGSHE